MYINHLTLSTGACHRSPRGEVGQDVIDFLFPWMVSALDAKGAPCPLPGDWSAYHATLLAQSGALVVTVFGRAPQVGRGLPLVSFGVAHRSRHASKLWEALTQPGAGVIAAGVEQPPVPYLAVHVHPTATADRDALRWLPDFERAVAWTWICRQPPERPDLKLA
jgi:hypothetical protein